MGGDAPADLDEAEARDGEEGSGKAREDTTTQYVRLGGEEPPFGNGKHDQVTVDEEGDKVDVAEWDDGVVQVEEPRHRVAQPDNFFLKHQVRRVRQLTALKRVVDQFNTEEAVFVVHRCATAALQLEL